MTAVNHVFTVFSLFAFTSASIPLTWHLTEASSWGVSACLFIFWSGLSSLVWFVNSIVWDANIVNWTPVWCDISTRIAIATVVGIPASALALQRRMYFMVRQSSSNETIAQKRRALAIDLLIGLGLPILCMILSVVVQGHRFDILEDVGCYPAIVNTSLTYFLVTLWPIFIWIASFVFIALNATYFYCHRHDLDSWMECTTSSLLSTDLYARFVSLGLFAFLLSFALSLRDFVSQATSGSVAWPGWDVVHADFWRVDQIPRGIWAAKDGGFGIELRRWVCMCCAVLAFVFLGTTREAGERYRAFGRMVLRVVSGGKGGQQQEGGNGDLKSGDVVKAYYTHEEIVLPIIKKHHEQFHSPPSPTASTPSIPSTPTISRTPSVKAQPTALTSPSPSPVSKPAARVPAPKLSPYGPSYGVRAAIRPEDVGGRGRIPVTPTSPGFGGGDRLGALLSSSWKDKSERGGKKEKLRPKVMMTPF
jgi:pheromone a factor receptor